MGHFFRFTLTGLVQGIGFRPLLYRACTQARLLGFVQNIGEGVVVVVNDAEAFQQILNQLPAPIRLDTIAIADAEGDYTDFTIRESTGHGLAEIPPDFFLCDACLAELLDPNDRRYRYFFITCTQCGPRFSLAASSPYDRATTAMKDFAMCAPCTREYTDPTNRRFHAETIACHTCGPKLTLFRDRKPLSFPMDQNLFQEIGRALTNNEVVAVKGIGGFHLFSNTEPTTLHALNTLTGRSHKPYALLCRDLAMAKTICLPTPKETQLLTSPERPIVLIKKRVDAPEVSELDTIGIMLASTALHILLFEQYSEPLICTSSNLANAPITTTQEEQFVPLVLDHNRGIINAIDDSIVKVIRETPILLRRSRGFVPRSIAIRSRVDTPVLALGAERNNTFALYDGKGRVILSQHLGNTTHPQTFARYQASIHHFLASTRIVPQVILCDAHPEALPSLFGTELATQLHAPLIPIQHHRAHAYGVAAEHGLDDFAAIVCDGLGYGDDGALWGGEIFSNHTRIGHLEEHPLLGGDAAARFPHRMLYAILRSFLSPAETLPFFTTRFSPSQLALLEKQFIERFNAPPTSSCGRVLDAAAAFLDLCDERTYDGRPALLLEAASSQPFSLKPVIENSVLLTTPMFQYLIAHRQQDPKRLAATVAHYLAAGLYTIAARENKPLVWAGGCVANRLMTEYFLSKGVRINQEIPPGDGGISFGQIAAYLKDPLSQTGNNETRRP